METRNISLTAIFSSLYAILVILLAPISFSPVQLCVADCLIPLAALFGWPIIVGVTLGCLVGKASWGYKKELKSKYVAFISVLAAVYAVTSYLPISVYIGGEALITANVIILPLMAYLLDARYAIISAFIGALAMYLTGIAIAPVYGYFTILIPVLGVLFGSLTKKNCVAALPWIAFGTISYVLYSGGTLLWLTLYIFASVLSLLTVKFKQLKIINCCVSTTISELIAMDMGNIFLMKFPGFLWIIILPFAIYERTVAVLGSMALIRGLKRYAGTG